MHSSPMVEFFFIFKHSKRFHCIAELLGVVVVYFSWGREANRRGDAIVFLRLLPTRHGAAINVVQQIKKQILHHYLAHFFLSFKLSKNKTWTIPQRVNKTLINTSRVLQLACSVAANTILCKHSTDSNLIKSHLPHTASFKSIVVCNVELGKRVDQDSKFKKYHYSTSPYSVRALAEMLQTRREANNLANLASWQNVSRMLRKNWFK